MFIMQATGGKLTELAYPLQKVNKAEEISSYLSTFIGRG
jgi:hypothetical protein